MIDKANEIIGLIEKNERAVEELEKCLNGDGGIYVGKAEFYYKKIHLELPQEMDFETWEIRLMIHTRNRESRRSRRS